MTSPWPELRWGEKCECGNPNGKHAEDCWRCVESVYHELFDRFGATEISQEFGESSFSSMDHTHTQCTAARREAETVHRMNQQGSIKELLEGDLTATEIRQEAKGIT